MKPGLIKVAAFAIVLATPLLAMAQTSPVLVPNVGLPGSANATIGGSIQSIITGILLPIAGFVAVLFLIIGGFQFMLAGTNEDLAKKGKTTIRNALIGLIVIILSYVIIVVVVNTLTRSRL